MELSELRFLPYLKMHISFLTWPKGANLLGPLALMMLRPQLAASANILAN